MSLPDPAPIRDIGFMRIGAMQECGQRDVEVIDNFDNILAVIVGEDALENASVLYRHFHEPQAVEEYSIMPVQVDEGSRELWSVQWTGRSLCKVDKQSDAQTLLRLLQEAASPE